MVSEAVTTLFDYQLAMLHPMNKSAPIQAAELLDCLGATQTDTAAAEKRWFYSAPENNFRSIDAYVTAWGAPTSDRTEPLGTKEIRYARWDLTFWPGLQIEFTELHRGYNVFRQLRRRPDLPSPQINSVADLTPWSCTCEELQNSGLAPVDFVDGFGAVGDVFYFTATDPDTDRHQRYFAYVDWCLLQRVEPAPDWYTHDQRPNH